MSAPTLNSIVVRALETGWAVNAEPWQDSFPDTAPQPRWRRVTFDREGRQVVTFWAKPSDDLDHPEYLSGRIVVGLNPTLFTAPLRTPGSVLKAVYRGGAGA